MGENGGKWGAEVNKNGWSGDRMVDGVLDLVTSKSERVQVSMYKCSNTTEVLCTVNVYLNDELDL